ncbi:hypothetical protein NL676_029382 [Syzygium grande]|nr:hypothetical protein NL676_029382 [Syzygium grande]
MCKVATSSFPPPLLLNSTSHCCCPVLPSLKVDLLDQMWCLQRWRLRESTFMAVELKAIELPSPFMAAEQEVIELQWLLDEPNLGTAEATNKAEVAAAS